MPRVQDCDRDIVAGMPDSEVRGATAGGKKSSYIYFSRALYEYNLARRMRLCLLRDRQSAAKALAALFDTTKMFCVLG